MKIVNTKQLGRYKNPNTNRLVSIYSGQQARRNTEVTFFLRNSKRIFISAAKFQEWTKEIV